MMTLEEAVATYEQYALDAKQEKLSETYRYYTQLAAWLRELQERRKEPKIIFCKDCVDWGTEDCAMVQIVDNDPDYDWRTNPDGYCHVAERRTE